MFETGLKSDKLIVATSVGHQNKSGITWFSFTWFQDWPVSITFQSRIFQIYSWLESLPDKHPNVVKMITVGYSYENRRILGVKLSYSDSGYGFKKAVFLEGGIHPREWLVFNIV